MFTLMLVIKIVQVQIPTSNMRNLFIKASNLSGLHVPDCLGTTRVLKAHGYLSVRDPKHFLQVDISFVPAECIPEIRVSFEGFLEHCATNSHNQMHSN